MKHLVIGYGEVGSALAEVIGEAFLHDPEKGFDYRETCDVMHVAIPYSDSFVDTVKSYRREFTPRLTIIHATVAVGTTRLIGDAAYSFVRGKHPDLAGQMRGFTKHLGATSREVRDTAEEVLGQLGFRVETHDTPEEVELGKLWDTTYYGICIAATKLAKDLADFYGVSWAGVARMNETYNQGMFELGSLEFIRPELTPVPGRIGGHCIVPNVKILLADYTHPLLQAVVDAGKDD